MGSGKPRGIRAGRKLATKRRLQKYHFLYSDGTTRSTTLDSSAPDLKTPLWAAVWPRVSLSRRSVYNQNSPTQPSEKESESCSRRTERKSLLSYHGTDASTISLKTTRSWSLDSVKRENPKEIFRESVSKSSQSRASPSWHSSPARKRKNDRNCTRLFPITFSLPFTHV
jgi:hypothetical protein